MHSWHAIRGLVTYTWVQAGMKGHLGQEYFYALGTPQVRLESIYRGSASVHSSRLMQHGEEMLQYYMNNIEQDCQHMTYANL
jgi:hypothetical protein